MIPTLDERFRLTKAGATVQAGGARTVPAAAARPDWHNAQARLMLDLNPRLEACPAAAREALLESLAKSVAGGRAVDLAQGAASAPAPV